MSRVPGVVAAVELATALGAGCGGGGGTVTSGEAISLGELSEAAQASAGASSGRFAFSLEMSVPGAGAPFAFTGEGSVDAATERRRSPSTCRRSQSSGGLFAGTGGTDAPDLDDPDAWRIDAVEDGSVTYVRLPAIADHLPARKSWVKTEEGQAAGGTGLDFGQFQQFTGNDPREALDFLEA